MTVSKYTFAFEQYRKKYYLTTFFNINKMITYRGWLILYDSKWAIPGHKTP